MIKQIKKFLRAPRTILFTLSFLFPLIGYHAINKLLIYTNEHIPIVSIMLYEEKDGISLQKLINVLTLYEITQNIHIRYDVVPHEEYHNKLYNMIITHQPLPDIIYLWHSMKSNYLYQNNRIINLYNYQDIINFEQYHPQISIPYYNKYKNESGIYRIPTTISINSILYINKHLIKKFHFTIATSFAQLNNQHAIIQNTTYTTLAMGNQIPWVIDSTLLGTVIARISGNKNWFSDVIAGSVQFTDQHFIESLQYIKNLVTQEVLQNTNTTDYTESLATFNKGKALYMIDGHWQLRNIDNPQVLRNLIMTPLPYIQNQHSDINKSVNGETSSGYGISSDSIRRNGTRAVQLLSYLYSPEILPIWYQDSLLIPPLKDYAPEDYTSNQKQLDLFIFKSSFYNTIDTYTETPDQMLPIEIVEYLDNEIQHLINNTEKKDIMEIAQILEKKIIKYRPKKLISQKNISLKRN